MKGIELSEACYNQHGAQIINARFAGYKHRIATGLVGRHLECIDADDKVSADCDRNVAFCLWLDEKDYKEIGSDLQAAYQVLLKASVNCTSVKGAPELRCRTGVFSTQDFYQSLIGLDHVPETLEEWWCIPEHGLSAATNGRVFHDPLGQFTEFRNRLAAYYPEDVRLKKIETCCMTMAQIGQSHYIRSLKHDEMLTAQIALNQFIEATCSMMYLLNKTYQPAYPRMLKAMKDLPVLGRCLFEMLQKFWEHCQLPKEKMERYNSYLIEGICAIIIRELKRQGLSDCESRSLGEHGACVQRKIGDPWLKNDRVQLDSVKLSSQKSSVPQSGYAIM